MTKRTFDVAAAVVLLVTLAPLLLAIGLIVRVVLGAPVFHRPLRPGKDGRLFRMVKFRTMSDETDQAGNLLPDDQRTSALGGWLRRSSVDELPELWNVLRGEMSLVGPRPLLPQYLELYTPEQRERHLVKPGMTGWAQINGRNAISWTEKFDLDTWYVRNRSFRLDLVILWRTAKIVLRQDNIGSADHPTMPIFEGNPASLPDESISVERSTESP